MAHRDVYGMQAIADHFGVKMYIITSYREGEIIEINPIGRLRSERVLYLSFWAEVRSFLPRKAARTQIPPDECSSITAHSSLNLRSILASDICLLPSNFRAVEPCFGTLLRKSASRPEVGMKD